MDGSGFDFTAHIDRVCRDMIVRVPALWHVDMDCVARSFSRARNGSAYGVFASVTPLRFDGGGRETVRRGRRWGMPQLIGLRGQDLLYVLNFYLPRYLNLPWREKLTTVAHELWHISPRCDGQLRRFEGRFHTHGKSQKAYDARVGRLVDAYLSTEPEAELLDVLRLDFAGLGARFGGVTGAHVRVPKLMRLD